MAKLKQWLREWLGIAGIERAATHEHDLAAKWRTVYEKEIAAANNEIDRLRAIICTTPEQVKKTYKPRNWRETTQLMGKV